MDVASPREKKSSYNVLSNLQRTRKIVQQKIKTIKNLNTEQRIIVLSLLVILISLPVALSLTLKPKAPRLPYATPITPPTTPTPTPTPIKYPINWVTDTVYMKADSFTIKVNGMYFHADDGTVSLHSDPGSPTYTTLEADWHENGVEMRFYLYFAADKTSWWISEMRIYNGTTRPDWIYFPNPLAKMPLGRPYIGNHGFATWQTGLVPPPAEINFEGWILLPFRRGVIPSVTLTPTPTPISTRYPIPTPTVSVRPSPTPARGTSTPVPTPLPTPVVNNTPTFMTRVLSIGFVGRKYKSTITATDKDTDRLQMEITNMAPGLKLGTCDLRLDNLNGQTGSRLSCEINGTPKKAGIYYPVAKVTDEHGAYSVKVFRQIILPRFLIF